ncbi:sporulation inhibitor of replication protein SirA [Bacillus andreraoultii]|uniref:sporulation inhibitor of replication protein SirA n=1 Tax=Bacillus andreraoultii TaxID=1499685 RepID=UPI00053B4F47|nr:sporulation inhibitor of replication protein SirA [Bacillus andreraoultii]
MRRYDLYIIEDLFANYYYGREYFFYNLFKEYENANRKMKPILLKQVEYISSSIPVIRIHRQLMEQLKQRDDFYMKNGMFLIENSRGSASFAIQTNKCILQSRGSFDIDMVFMEALRKTDFNFLAIDIANERFGWVKPIKETTYLEPFSVRRKA